MAQALTRASLVLAVTAAAHVLATEPGGVTTPASITGFTASTSASELALEKSFDAGISAGDLHEWLERMSYAPNYVGAPHNKENAELVLELFRAWGWDARIERFDVLYPTLKRHSLELLAPTRFVASLEEPAIEHDASSARARNVPTYNTYGADGDVTAELVYVNYGMPEDYQALARRGIDVKGKIVIARYGQGWRGLKPKLAYEHGAVGCLIYSDPHDDGYANGDVYPAGGWRPAGSVQRGSVADMPMYPGDPLTPGTGATARAKRLPLAQAKSILKIPVMPISYGDAQPLLAALRGPVAPPEWRGSLPLTYHMGPGPAQVRLLVESDWSLQPLYNVIAKIPGAHSPDEWVMRGNHRDAWVLGAWDPLSAHGAMLAEAKALGGLLKSGWRPKRTIVYASWDGEEPGLLGSTEWAETHAEELQRKAVVYINSDTNTRGFLSASGSHTWQRFVNEIAAEVRDPQTGATVKERLRAKMLVDAYEPASSAIQQRDAERVADGADFPLGSLGSGSDFTPFLQHLGIAALNLEYGGEGDQVGAYHSIHDTFEHYVRFGDPGFAYGVAEAQTVGRAVLRMSNADVLPLQLADFADVIDTYVEELHVLTAGRRAKAERLDKLLASNAFTLAADPTRAVSAPETLPSVPYLEFAPLDNAVVRLKKSATDYDTAYRQWRSTGFASQGDALSELNAQLRGLERALIYSAGLPGREWYKHLVYAPGLLTGYDVKTLPGVREAIEADRWDEANRFAAITAAALGTYCDQLNLATALLRGAMAPAP